MSSIPLDLGPRYRGLRELGRGGAGVVYLAEDTVREEAVALKILHGDASHLCDIAGFRREFALLAHLEHPALAQAFDFGFLAGRPYFTTRFVPGTPLAALDTRNFAADELFTIFRDVVDALAFLHARDVLHLDIKPGNIIYQRDRDPTATLIDLGLYRRQIELGDPRNVGVLRGSLPYMAPECFSAGELGPWTDVYSLGASFYRLATGRPPRPGGAALARKAANAEPVAEELAWPPVLMPPSRSNARVPLDWEALILRALALDPTVRFRSALELSEALAELGSPRHRGKVSGTGTRTKAGSPSPTRTIGRESEAALAVRFLDRLGLETGAAGLLVTGEPGAGASHFLRDIQVFSQTRGREAYLLAGYPGRASPPGSVLRYLAAHLRGDDPDSGARLGEFLDRLARPRKTTRGETSDGERRLRRALQISKALDALRRPMLLVIDGLQFFDEVSIALIVDLLRLLAPSSPAEPEKRPPLGIVLGYREEGPHVALLAEASHWFTEGANGAVITLRPLDLESTRTLFLEASGRRGSIHDAKLDRKGSPLALFQKTRGLPLEIALLARGSDLARPAAGATAPRTRDARGLKKDRKSIASLSRDVRDVLGVLVLLQRPASERELGTILDCPTPRISAALRELESTGHVRRNEGSDSDGGIEVVAREHDAPLAGSASVRRRLHRSIARALTQNTREPGPALVEAAKHSIAGGAEGHAIETGLEAARYLESTYQNRAALEILEQLSALVPRRRIKLRHDLALEIADLRARIGELDAGLTGLREHLARPEVRRLPRAARWRARLRLASLHGRRGDFTRADAAFREVFGELRAAASGGSLTRAGIDRHEVLWFLNEHAAVAGFLGRHDAALELCAEGLRLAGRSRAHDVRESALNFHATRANVLLRRFEPDAAVRSFERALAIAESIGSEVNHAVILNNLGIVHIQLERLDDALGALRHARELCRRLDEGPSLVSVLANIAVVEARRGAFSEAFATIEKAEGLRPQSMGQRQELFVEHAAGLCEVHRGRPHRAASRLERAVTLARAIGDEHIARHDEVYLAEALVHGAQYVAADRLLERILSSNPDARIRRLALARRALLLAWLGCEDDARTSLAAYDQVEGSPPHRFLAATDALCVGWTLTLLGEFERASERLAAAERSFRERRAPAWVDLTRTIAAEATLGAGDRVRARELVAELPSGHAMACIIGALVRARIELENARDGGRRRAGDLLAGAGSSLAGNPLPEQDLRLRALRARIAADAALAADATLTERTLAGALPEEWRESRLSAAHRKGWLDLEKAMAVPGPSTNDSIDSSGDALTDPETEAMTTSLDSPFRTRIVARSRAMRSVIDFLDRVHGSELSILIRGETGTGKELLARVIHDESPRRGRSFTVLDCAALCSGVIDAELFGVRAGAFTDAIADRPGILSLANGGTVLVDDTSALTAEAQAKLLRVVEASRIRPVGAEKEEPIDVRFLFSATHDLEEHVASGRFRADLYHRIAVLAIDVPPLRERRKDLPELATVLLLSIASTAALQEAANGGSMRSRAAWTRRLDRSCASSAVPVLEQDAIAALLDYDFPGNVRELENVLLRLAVTGAERIDREAVRSALDDATTTVFPRHVFERLSLGDLHERLEREYLRHHFHRLGGDFAALAGCLETSRRQLYRRFARLGISLRDERRRLRGG